MLQLFKGHNDKHPPRQFSLALLKLIELEGLVSAVNKFYDRLPKLVVLKRPAFDEMLKTILYRVTYAIMHPKIIERFQNFLPIENDSGGYFFVTRELQAARIKTEGTSVSQVQRDAILGTLEGILTDGLKVFHNLPAYRYFAVTAASSKSRAFSEDMRGIIETISLLAKDTRTADGYKRELGERTVSVEAAAYEKNIIPKVRLSAMLLYSLYFDLNNLFLGEFSDQSIERAIEAALGEDFPKDSFGGSFPALMDKRLYDKLKQKKIDYLNGMRQRLENRLYAPLALHLFRQNVALDSRLSGAPYKAFSELKVLEFLEYNQSEDYRGYVNFLKSAKDIRCLLGPAVKELSQQADSATMVVKYLQLFFGPARSGSRLACLKTKQFIELWIRASRCRWDKELASSVSIVPVIVNDPKLLQLLMHQRSAALVLMLKDTGFRDYLKRADAGAIDFNLLYKVFCRGPALFNQVYPRLIFEDKKFVQALVNLLSRAEDASGIVITDDLRSLVTSLENYDPGDSKALIYLLKNFEAAQRALDYGYTPFSGRFGALSDKLAFAKWFFANQQLIAKKLTLADTVLPYLGDTKNPQLREALSQLLEKQGEEFLKNLGDLRNWGHSQSLSQEALAKVARFFTAQSQAKRLLKRREIVNLVQYMAENASSGQWQEFFAECTRINGSALTDYAVIFEKYPAPIILQSMQTHADIKAVKIIVETFAGSGIDQQKSFLQRLLSVLTQREIPNDLLNSLCLHITKKHYAIADFGISQLEKGKFPAEVIQIINAYQNDEEFRNSPPDVD